jgi:hypothetical protein
MASVGGTLGVQHLARRRDSHGKITRDDAVFLAHDRETRGQVGLRVEKFSQRSEVAGVAWCVYGRVREENKDGVSTYPSTTHATAIPAACFCSNTGTEPAATARLTSAASILHLEL